MHRRGVIAVFIGAYFSTGRAAGKQPMIVDLGESIIVRYNGEAIELSGRDIIDALKSKPLVMDAAPPLLEPYPILLTEQH